MLNVNEYDDWVTLKLQKSTKAKKKKKREIEMKIRKISNRTKRKTFIFISLLSQEAGSC